MEGKGEGRNDDMREERRKKWLERKEGQREKKRGGK